MLLLGFIVKCLPKLNVSVTPSLLLKGDHLNHEVVSVMPTSLRVGNEHENDSSLKIY